MADIGIRLSAKDDTGAAFGSVNRSLDKIKDSAGTVGQALAGLGVGLSAGAFVAFAKQVIDSVDALNDLKDATGASIENISALEDIALRTGGSLDTVATALIKMNQGLSSAKAGSDTALAIEAIGLSVKDLKALDPAEAFRQVAIGLSGFSDDANKARIVQELFGKSLKDVAPLLNNVADAGTLVGTVTTEQTLAAEELNKQFFVLQTNALQASRSFVSDLIPTISMVAAEFNKAESSSMGFATTIGSVVKTSLQTVTVLVSDVIFVLKGMGREIGGIVAQFSALGEGGGVFSAEGRAAWNAVGSAMREDAESARKELDAFQKKLFEMPTSMPGNTVGDNSGKKSLADIEVEKARLKALEDARKAAAKAGEDYRRELTAESNLLDTLSGYSSNYSEDMNRLAKGYAAGRIGLEQLGAAQRAVFDQQPIAKAIAKEQEESAKAAAKAYADEQKAYEDKLKVLENSAQSVADQVQRLQDEEKAAGMAAAQNISLAVALEQVGLARVREAYAQQAAAGADGQTLLALQKEIDAREKIIGLTGSKEARTASETAAKKAADDWKKTADQIEETITDALMRGWENGLTFAQNFRDTVVNMFKTLVLRPIVSAVVNPVAGALTGAMGLSGNASAADSALGAANTISSANTLSSMGAWFTDFKMSSTNAIYDIGGKLTTMGAEKLGSVVTQNATAIGSFMTTAGYALAAVSALDAASQGKWGAAIGTGLGAAFFGPLGGAIGGALGGWVDSAFGGGHEYTTGQGIQGNFSGAGFSGSNYQTWRNEGSSGFMGIGGSGSSSGKNLSALDASTQSSFSLGFTALQIQAASMADSLGLSAKALDTYSRDVSIALGSDAAANQKAIEAMFLSVADGISLALVPSIASLAKSDETASVTLSRLSSSILTANAWLALLNEKLFAVSLAGGEAASKLADAFGGLDKLSSSSQAFYDAYFSSSEKIANSQEQMTKALAVYGIALPASKQALKDMAASLDLTTDSGRAAYVTLLNLAPTFASTADLIASSAKDSATSLLKAFTGSDFDKTVIRFTALGDALSGASIANFTEVLGQVFDTLAARIATVVDGIQTERDAVSAAALEIVAPGARSMQAIAASIASIRTAAPAGLDASQAGSAQAAASALLAYQEELQAFAVTAAKSVSQLSDLRVETVKYYEAQQALAELMNASASDLLKTVASYRYSQLQPDQQAASLQSQFASAYSMALASQGDGSTLSSYAGQLNTQLGPLIEALKANGQDNLIANALAQAENVAALLQETAPKTYTADSLELLGSIDGALVALGASSKSVGVTIADAIAAGAERTAAGLHAIIAALSGESVPAFASGAAFGGGVVKRPSLFSMGQMGEAGPEAIMPLANINGSLGVRTSGGSDVVNELRALRAEVSNLRIEARATAVNTGKSTKLWERVTQDGTAVQTVVAA